MTRFRAAFSNIHRLRDGVLLVAALFRAGLGRFPEPDALTHYLSWIGEGNDAIPDSVGRKIAAAISRSAEAVQRHGKTRFCDAAYFRRIWKDAAGEAPEPCDLLGYCQGRMREEALLLVASRPEARRDLNPFRLCFPDSAPPDDDLAYGLWRLQYGMNSCQKCESDPACFDLYLSVTSENIDLACRTLESFQKQTAGYWNAYVHADRDVLERLGAVSAVRFASASGYAGTASHMAVFQPGDCLADNALGIMSRAVRENDDAIMFFSDRDSCDEKDGFFQAELSPGWSDDQLLRGDTAGGLTVFSRKRLERVLPVVPGPADGSCYSPEAVYALKLAVVEGVSAAHVIHVPEILLHGRAESCRAHEQVCRNHLERFRPAVHVGKGALPVGEETQIGVLRIFYPLPDILPKVSIIVPTRDRPDFIGMCIGGILEKTRYDNLEVIILDNGSENRDVLHFLSEVAKDSRVHVCRDARPFNWSALNNAATGHASGELVLFLNDDVAILHEDWLEEMVRQISRPHVGIVGARLLYPDYTVQHAGIAVTGDGAIHVMRGAEAGTRGYCDSLFSQRDVSAVTGACLMIRKDLLEHVGGLDETFPVSCNDVDLCLRVRAAGWRIVWTPFATLTHVDGGTRGRDATPVQILQHWRETARLLGRWHRLIALDDRINRNLDVRSGGLLLKM